ncbi:MAG TPA: YlxR family protein [Jatrophihabitantaceae bacterium]|nr:YlxR family protein [Jatrophihabitantaceae bacterium]
MSSQVPPQSPIRTCIGCRRRAAAAELLRVVVAPDPSGAQASVVPDPRHRASGRGAWLHPDPECVGLAERRRAFGRALHVSVPLDTTPVREYVAGSVTTSGNHQRNPAGD